MTQREILEWLKEHKKGTIREISDDLKIARSRIPDCIGKLESKGVKIERHKGKQNRVTYEFISDY